MVKENFLHEYPRINCDILTKSYMECSAHANAEHKLQPHCDKRIMPQKQTLCSVIQYTEFAQRETNATHYTRNKNHEIYGRLRNFCDRKQKAKI
jgi:hypothetical protein